MNKTFDWRWNARVPCKNDPNCVTHVPARALALALRSREAASNACPLYATGQAPSGSVWSDRQRGFRLAVNIRYLRCCSRSDGPKTQGGKPFNAVPLQDIGRPLRETAVRRTLELRPDVVLMDLNLPGTSGLEATRRIVAGAPQTGVLVLTMVDEADSVMAALRVGARGYVLKGAVQEEVLAAVPDGGRPVARCRSRRRAARVL
jgi:CheY-like chemotaxis protein